MASAHLSAKIISRGSGHSAVAKAAYNAREELDDRRTGETHDYTRHSSKCLFQGIYAPKGAPEWAHDRAQLWNHVEAFERRRNSQLAQDIDLALPHELTLEQNRYLLQDWVKENVTRKGLIADVAIHAPARHGDDRNIHAHVMIVMRKLDGSEFVRAKERFNTLGEKVAAQKADLTAMRESWEKLANRHLERHGHEARINMGRKEDGEATLHMGRHATAQERRGSVTEIGNLNREIAAANENRDKLRDHVRAEVQQGKQRDADVKAQIKEDLREHRRDHAARDPATPETGRREAGPVRRPDPTRQASDRSHAAPQGRGGPDFRAQVDDSREVAAEIAATQRRERGPSPQERRNAAIKAADTRRAVGRAAGIAGEGTGKAVKAAGGLLGIIGKLAGGAASAVTPPTPQKGQEAKRPRSLAEIAREVQAKQAAKPKDPEKEQERDKSRSRFEARPVTRLLATVSGGHLGWVAEARRKLIAYSERTGEAVLEQLIELDRIIFRALYGPA